MKVNAKKWSSNFYHLILGIFILLLPNASFSQSNTDILDSPFSYQCNDKLIGEILIDLSKLSGISIAFDAGYFVNEKRSIQVANLALRKILKKVLLGTNTEFVLEESGLVLEQSLAKEFTISGFVEDNRSGERLVAATIYDNNSNRGAITNEYGFFSLTLPPGEHSIQCSYLGYQSVGLNLDHKSNKRMLLSLEPALTLAPIEVVAEQQIRKRVLAFTTPDVQFRQTDIEELPALGGEADVFRFLQSQPGITTGTDGIGGLHVRGGSTDQNLILLDGVPIFNPSHAFGLFSIFNPATLKSATLQRSGYSAKYGGHLSSVLDIRTKEGNVKQFQSSFEISTVATKVSAEIPLGNEKGGLMIAARRSHLDPVIQSISRRDKMAQDVKGEASFFFYDLNAKLNYKIGNKDRFYLSFYRGEDRLSDLYGWAYEDPYFSGNNIAEYNSSNFLDWGNTITSLRWNHIYGDKLFSNATFTISAFKYQNIFSDSYIDHYYGEEYEDNYYKRFFTNIKDYRFNISFDYYANSNHHLLWGGTALRRSFEPGSFSADLEVLNDTLSGGNADDFFDDFFEEEIFTTDEVNFFIEDRIQLGDKHKLTIGLHHAIFHNEKAFYHSLQPRLNYAWQLSRKMSLGFSASRMSQFLHLLTATDAGLPNDLWVPATEKVGPQHAWEFALNTQYQLAKNWSLEMAAYHKKMENVLTYGQNASLPGLGDYDPTFWEDEVVVGDGAAYGLETALNWKSRKTLLNVNYTWSRSWRTFAALNEGKRYPFRYDRPHNFNVFIRQRFNEHWTIQAQWQFKTGLPITLFSTEFPIFTLDGLSADFASARSSINGYRLPDYHRLDLNASYSFGNDVHRHQITIGAYNLYDRENPIYTFLIENPYYPEDNGLQSQSGLKLIPTIGYRWNWN